MKASVDQDNCIGCGLCVSSCPAVFSMEGVVATAIADAVPPAEEENASAARDECPVSVIDLQAE